MENVNVLFTMPFPQTLMDRLAAVSPVLNIRQHEVRNADELVDMMGDDIDVLYTGQVLPMPENAPRLRWVQLHLAGIDSLLEHPLYTQSEVVFTTASGIHPVPMAEYAFAQMLAFAHHVPRMLEDQAAGTWTHERWNRYVPSELYGATLGIVGYGSVGGQIARLGQAFGMRVLALKHNVRQMKTERYSIPGTGDPENELPDRIYPPQALRSFLSECDYVVLTIPLTRKTRHLINAAALAAMKPTSILVNVSRGDVVDEKALVEALEKKVIAAAALDVFSQEPLPPESPLWKLPNVIISPHVSGFTPHYDERATDLFAENLRRFIGGLPLLNVVDRSNDY